MPRVNLEAKLFGSGRLLRFQAKMGWDRRQALGALALLWHDSQGDLRLSGSAAEIAEWAWSEEDVPRLIAALLATRFIRDDGDGTYHICGNADQLAWITSRREAAAKGGKANKDRMLRSHVDSHVDSQKEPNEATMQGNARQCKAKQEDITPKPPRKRGTQGPDFKSRAMALIGTMLGAPPDAWTDDAKLEGLLGPEGWSVFRRRFPRGGEQFLAYWEGRQKEGTPQGVMTAQLRDTFVGFMGE